ncbi:glycosyltransferase [Gorillibacterium timonense]|uniref:glycosyltransferase n=1 Tax=Gorillibacterium timonense TaxID=1689269 RepID=UPI00071CBEC0|nr:glycosyltransferase family 2 protein [Gorillibacterium timonense]
MPIRVLIASPVQQKPQVLELFLKSLSLLKTAPCQVGYLFLDNNDLEASRELLKGFQAKTQDVTIQERPAQSYERDEHSHYWDTALIDKVAGMKDAIIEHALEHHYDALFLVDSDLLLYPDTLLRLLAVEKEIISSIFWTKWQAEGDPLPQVWLMDEYLFFKNSGLKNDRSEEEQAAAFLQQMRTPGIYEVGGLGACTLIRQSALSKGVRFHRLPNLSFMGEDRHFCIRAAALGISLFVDTRYPAYHIYRESDLLGGNDFLRSIEGFLPSGITISLCMIVKNEEEALGKCLESVQGIADEINIIDTGSTDRTKELAETFKCRIFDYKWHDDFSAARNFAFDQATKDYILWLDADDVLLEEDRLAFLALKGKLDSGVDSVMMHYVLATDNNGKPTISLKRNRLVRRACQFRWIGPVHEYLEVFGRIEQSEIQVTHGKNKAYTDRNLQIYRKRKEKGDVFSPRDLYYFANELRDHAFYEEAVEQYELFLAGKNGWIEDQIGACLKLADSYEHVSKRDLQLRSLFRTMELDLPRAESCCALGKLFLSEQRFHQAVYWYEKATQLSKPSSNGALVDHASWSWLPYLQLCVCYDKLGEYRKANECNETALALCPGHPSMLMNRDYFRERLGKEERG